MTPHRVQAWTLIKLVLQGVPAAHHVVGTNGGDDVPTLHDRNTRMTTASNQLYGKINSMLQRAALVRRGIQLSRHLGEVFDVAKPDQFHLGLPVPNARIE
jgi:hypothetical protein